MAITAAEIQIILTATATQFQEKLAAAQSAIGQITAKVVSAQATMKASEKPLTMGATPEAVAKLQANIGRMSAAIAGVSAKDIQAQAAMKASERPLTMGATPEVVAQVQSNVRQMGARLWGRRQTSWARSVECPADSPRWRWDSGESWRRSSRQGCR